MTRKKDTSKKKNLKLGSTPPNAFKGGRKKGKSKSRSYLNPCYSICPDSALKPDELD